jgi:serine acetyltransferase
MEKYEGRLTLQQWRYLQADLARLPRRTRLHWLTYPLEPGFVPILHYRLARAACLLLGRRWNTVRHLLAPLKLVFAPWLGRCEIHALADIGPGLRIMHSSLGIVVSAMAVIGRDFTMTGGNCIGVRADCHPGEIWIGDDVNMGIHSTILGPVRVGNGCRIGAGAVVVNDVPDGATVVGVPARSTTAP